MQLSYLIPPLVAFGITLIALHGILKFFPKWGLLDRPHEYGINRAPIPYSAGIIFFLVFLLAVIFFVNKSPVIVGVTLAGFLITVVSFLDDRKRLSPRIRLAVQILAGVIVVAAGMKLQIISNPFSSAPIYLDHLSFSIAGQTIWIFSAALIIVWLVLMMNVMNWLDGIPGLSSGISTISYAALFLLSIQQFNVVDQSSLITISSVLAAAAFAFLFFDFYPPKLLMGDTGSMFLGFMLGVLSILSGGKIATALLIMGFAVVDAFWVVLRRMLEGKSPLHGDLGHFHHRLLRVGLTERKALIFNYVICALFAAIALLLNSAYTKLFAFLGVVFLMLCAGVFLFYKNKRKSSPD